MPIDPLISNILKWEEKRRRELLKQKENQAKDIAKLKEDLFNLTADATKSHENIEKNLTSIMSHKHNIHKTLDSSNEIGLPITNTYHGEFLNFVSNTISFVNEVSETDKHNPDSTIDDSKLSSSVKMCNENIMKRIHEDNNVVDEMETIMNNMNEVGEFYTPIVEEELPSSESSFFDGI
ncbi:hypothetical protein PV325_006039 [Microctonus aethiopoides]|uniref:Uncharacterized protein n=1 Tax=Microctonus aethiopoides TaxID=144406 RepID=A0AA39FHZ7_9HYME|nr:hypothetical protein PV326_012321 [Microctonus aethiopoides]KAK0075996.1 hypothetical protein PV325_006039 [Microctonus aethiopoides]KAK0169858.1 hypothetical protein PV328_010493 [Microctonus aethiopoides]